jgi:hypothetical protein
MGATRRGLFMMGATAGYRRASGGTLECADCQRERDQKPEHLFQDYHVSFIRLISPFAGFHEVPRRAIGYARFQ